MPGRLKSLEMQGYKTFANRTLFEFAEKVTAIVGPNGSGKSNIADSLRWVLGEQSYHLLRGKKTEDMIFSGSELRPRAGMASATIAFDNSDGWLPIDFSEVAITRRAYRDGANEYLINGQRVRLKDVSELLAQSGLAERTYTIIGQGLVDAALALRAEERRKLFEEAAGIGLYRARRDEALRRLENTQRNLERVEDILSELEPRLRSLEKQAQRALEYEQVKADLQVLLRDWYGFHWRRAQQELTEARNVDRVQSASLEKARSELAVLDESFNEKRQEIHATRIKLNAWLQQSNEFQHRRDDLRRELAVADERSRSIEQQRQDIQDELIRLDDDSNLQLELIESVKSEAARLSANLDDNRSQLVLAQQALSERQSERDQLDAQIQEVRQQSGRLNSRLGHQQARLAERSAQFERDRTGLEAAEGAVELAEKEQQAARLQEETANAAKVDAERQAIRLDETLNVQKIAIDEAESRRKALLESLGRTLADFERLNARKDVIEQAEATLSGYTEGTRILLQAVRQRQLEGRTGALSQYLDVPSEYELAVSAALGQFLESALLDSDPEIAFLTLEEGGGRAALLPLDQLRPESPIRPDQFQLGDLSDPKFGWIGVASDLVGTSTDFRPAVDVLLGSTWVVHNRQAARQVIHAIDWSGRSSSVFRNLRLATLQGEILYASGPVISAEKKNEAQANNLLSRQRQHRELLEQIGLLEVDLVEQRHILEQQELKTSQLSDQYSQMELDRKQARQLFEQTHLAVQQARLAGEQAQRHESWQQEQRRNLEGQIINNELEIKTIQAELVDLESQITKSRNLQRELSNSLAGLILDEFQSQVANWNTHIAVTERALADERRRLGERQSALQKMLAQQTSLKQRLGQLSANQQSLQQNKINLDAEDNQLTQEIESLGEQIQPCEAALALLEKQLSDLEARQSVARQAVSLADHRHAQTRIVVARQQENLHSLQRRVEEDFGLVAFEFTDQVSGQTTLPLSGLVEQLPHIKQLPNEIEDSIKRQRAQLRRIGPINPEAQAEYQSVMQRYKFLTEQVADLKRAEKDIFEVIQELDILMERDFSHLFSAVAVEFKTIFQRLFGGGTARLVLTDPDNISETGIEIEASLPGRRTQGLSLLSGGERSLTATSLVFALMKVAPTPFCVLDEVDAMLDEANVGRFRELLSELSDHTQFVIVTHNRNTVQAAEIIYGVTMGRDSVSQVVSLKLDQVSTVID